MKLVIQVPCFNEEACLAGTLRDLPRVIPGIDVIEMLVIDDGSTDRTVDVARGAGVDVVCIPKNRGLAHAFMVGIDASLSRGADIIVNTDADNQYRGRDVEKLIAPILAGRAEIVVGARPIAEIKAFSFTKKLLQHLGSWIVRKVSTTKVADATSGFRAMAREAALQVNVFSRYTYTLETIVQAARRGLRVVSVPVGVNATTRESRLVRSSVNYLWRTGSDLVRILVVYRPFRSFMIPAALLFTIATIIALRFVYYFMRDDGGDGHVQSLILAGILYGLSGALMAAAFLGDLLAINRRMLEELQVDSRRVRLANKAREQADD